MPYKPIVATLGYVLSPDRKRVLLVHRNKRPDDPHFGKYNGLGGKLEADENVVDCIRREILEEAGIVCLSLRLRGCVSWPGFGKQGEDWFGFIFLVDAFDGTPFAENEDGALEWQPVEQILALPLWEGDKYFLPLVFGDEPRQFHGVMPYDGGRPIRWDYVWLGC